MLLEKLKFGSLHWVGWAGTVGWVCETSKQYILPTQPAHPTYPNLPAQPAYQPTQPAYPACLPRSPHKLVVSPARVRVRAGRDRSKMTNLCRPGLRRGHASAARTRRQPKARTFGHPACPAYANVHKFQLSIISCRCFPNITGRF